MSFDALMSLPANVISLRHLLAERFPETQARRTSATRIESGIACLDAVGWTSGSVVEVVGARAGAGVGLLLSALLEGQGQEVLRMMALVDGADAFHPSGLSGAALERLLWVRCRDAQQAMRAADLLLRDGNLSWVLMDVQLQTERELRRIPAQVWHRLRMLAEKSGVAFCVFTPVPLVPCTKGRLLLEQKFLLDDLDALRPALVERLAGRVTRGGVEERRPGRALAG